MQSWQGGAYTSAVAIVPSDTVPINARAIYVGGAGNVTMTLGPIGARGAPVTFTAVPVGTILPVGADEMLLNATNTNATLLVALA
jgi:hypothetical protein